MDCGGAYGRGLGFVEDAKVKVGEKVDEDSRRSAREAEKQAEARGGVGWQGDRQAASGLHGRQIRYPRSGSLDS